MKIYYKITFPFTILFCLFLTTAHINAGESKGLVKFQYTGWDGHKKQMPEAISEAKLDALERFANDNLSKSRYKDYMQAKNLIINELDSIVSVDQFIEETIDKKNKTIKLVIRASINENKLNFIIDSITASNNSAQSELSEMAIYIVARKASEIKLYKPREFSKIVNSETNDASETSAMSGDSATSYSTTEYTSTSESGGSTTQKSDKISYGPVNGMDENLLNSMSKIFAEYNFDIFDGTQIIDDRVRDEYMEGDSLSRDAKNYMWNATKDDGVPYLVLATVTIDAKAQDEVSGGVIVAVTVNGTVYECSKRCKTKASVGPVQYAKSAPRESEAERLALVLAAENAAQELIDQLNAKGIR